MTSPVGQPVAVTVAVPVSGSDAPIEVTVTLSARLLDPVPAQPDGPEPAADEPPPPPPPPPSAVVGGRIQGIRQRPTN